MSARSKLIEAAVASALSCAAAFILLTVLGTGLSSVFSGFDEHFYLKYFYDIHNRTTKAVQESDDIVIFDIHEFQTRSEVAAVIKRVSACNPAVIGLDVFMQKNGDIRGDADSCVVAALAGVGCPIVSPCVFDELCGCWQYPFYADSLKSSNMLYASPVAFDVMEQFGEEDPRIKCRTFAWEIVSAFLQGDEMDFERKAINYRNKEFFSLNDIDEIDSETVGGKIVLIGDCRSYNDTRSLPFVIMSSCKLPGVINIGYTANALLSTKEYCKSKDYSFFRIIYNRPFKRCRPFANLLISYVMCFLLSLLTARLLRFSPDGSKVSEMARVILSGLCVIAAEVIMVLLCLEVLTAVFLLVPDILLFMTSILFVNTGVKLVEIAKR